MFHEALRLCVPVILVLLGFEAEGGVTYARSLEGMIYP